MYNILNVSDNMASDDRTIGEWWIGKLVEGSSHDLIEALSSNKKSQSFSPSRL